jgi:hypothetical protein
MVLGSKTPELVRQEFYGLLLAHFAIRQLMHEAALSVTEDPDRLSLLHAVRVVRRKLSVWSAISPRARKNLHHAILDEILEERVVSSRKRWNPRGVERKMSKYPLRPRHRAPSRCLSSAKCIRIIK